MSVADVGDKRPKLGQRVMTPMEETDLHYLGGLIDAEGSIFIGAEKSSGHKCGFRLKPRFRLDMKFRHGSDGTVDLLKELAEKAGSSYKVRDNPAWHSTEDGDYAFSFTVISKSNVLPFLSEVFPYLRLKQDDADLILEAPWDSWYKDREAFEELVDIRSEIRSRSANRETKYTADILKNEVQL